MPDLHINGNLVTDITLGGQDVIRINHAVSGDLLWEKAQPVPTAECLCFTAGQSNSTVAWTSSLSTPPTIYKSTDKTNWTAWDGTSITLANVGDKLYVYGENSGVTGQSLMTFAMTGSIAASGECTTLLTRNGADTIPPYVFGRLFLNCSALTSAPSISASTVGNSACHAMFFRCSSLTSAPALPATTVGTYCYEQMFFECTSLVTGPAILPAATLAADCYDAMFSGCSALTSAPVLPAATLALSCYQGMFNHCALLDYVEVGAETWNSNYTKNWLANVAATGTLKATGAATGIPVDSADGVPSGWTIQLPNKNLTLSAIGANDTSFWWGQGAQPTNTLSVGSTVSTSLSQNGKITIQTSDWQYPICKNGVRCTPMAGMDVMYQFTYNDVADNDTITATYANYSYIYVYISCDIQNQMGIQPDYSTYPSESSQILNYTDYATVQVWEPDTLYINYEPMNCDLYLNGEKQTDNSWTFAQLEAIGNVNFEIKDKTTEIHFVNNTQSASMDVTEHSTSTQSTIQPGSSDTMSLVGDQWHLDVYGFDGGGGSVDLLLNGVSQGSDSANFYPYNLNDGDTITLVDA